MPYTTDIEKFYNLIGASSGSYKEIAGDEYSLRKAKRNWPLVRAMTVPPVEIPPVTVGEEFDENVNSTQALIHEQVTEVPAVDVLNVVELSKRKVRYTGKSPAVNKPVSAEPALSSLFRRLENGLQPNRQSSNLLKLRQL